MDYNTVINPPIDESTFGGRLKNARVSLNLSISEVATLCGVTKSVVSGYELGRYYPSLDILNLLSRKFNLSYLCRDGYTKTILEHDIFIKNIKLWIDKNNLTKQEAADMLGISRGLLRFWFEGSIIRPTTYYKIINNLELYDLI